jgi:hypothetical protein
MHQAPRLVVPSLPLHFTEMAELTLPIRSCLVCPPPSAASVLTISLAGCASLLVARPVFRRASAARHATGRIRPRTASALTGFRTRIHTHAPTHPRTHPFSSLESSRMACLRARPVWASASSRCGYLLSAAAWGRLLSELHRLKTFPPVELRGAREAHKGNLSNLCPAPACGRRSPRNSQFLCRVSAADQVSRLAHPLISPPFPQHNTDSLQSSAGYFRRLAVFFLPSGPSSLSSGNPAAGIASGAVDHESRQIAPFFPSTVRPGPFAAHIFSPCRLPTCPIPIPCLSVVGDAETGTFHVITRALTAKASPKTRLAAR